MLSIDTLSKEDKESYKDALALYDAVEYSIIRHAYKESIDFFEDKLENFDYFVDTTISKILPDMNAVVFIRAEDYIASAGRVAA